MTATSKRLDHYQSDIDGLLHAAFLQYTPPQSGELNTVCSLLFGITFGVF